MTTKSIKLGLFLFTTISLTSQITTAEQVPVDKSTIETQLCASRADVASRQFYICAQQYGAEPCFNDQILAYKPVPSCAEFDKVCQSTCEITFESNNDCHEICKN